jgi:peptidoglycan/xylan/chitin deacetylase (PgdA/CDA1 family)
MRLKRTLKRGIVSVARTMVRPDPSSRRIILTYHSVGGPGPIASTDPMLFRDHLQWLKETCVVVPLLEVVSGGIPSSTDRPIVALTFDDGYEDNHSTALPTLVDLGLTGTFFVTAGFIQREEEVISHFRRLWRCAEDDLDSMSWGQVRELRAAGMDVGSHSLSHANLARLGSADLRREVRGSRDLISDQLADAVEAFAYPFGKPRIHLTASTIEIVRASGYGLGVSTASRGLKMTDSRYAIPRFFTDGDTVGKLRDKASGAYEPIGWWQEHAPLRMLALMSPEDFKK